MAQVWHNFAPSEGQRWVRLAMRLVNEQTPPDVVAHLEYSDATSSAGLAEHLVALAAAERALTRYRQLDDPLGIVRAQWMAGQSLTYINRPDEGEPLLRLAFETVCSLDRDRLAALVRMNLGHALLLKGDRSAAREMHAEALTAFKVLGAGRCPPRPLHDFAEAAFWAGDVHAALEIASEGLSVCRPQGDLYLMSVYLLNIASYLIVLGRFDEARTHAHEALDLARRLRADLEAAIALQHLIASVTLRPHADAEQSHVHRRRAARLLAFVDAQYAAVKTPREPNERQEYDRIQASLHEVIDANELAALTASGAAMSQDEAIDEALRM
jgi:tetratricopeptide (TPR) repeat protein